MNIETITSHEFLTAASGAMRNGADKPALKVLCKQLTKFPKVEERLLFDFLELSDESLQYFCNPVFVLSWVPCWRKSVSADRQMEFVDALDRIVIHASRLLPGLASKPSATQVEKAHSEMHEIVNRPLTVTALQMVMVNALINLKMVDVCRFTSLIEVLRQKSNEGGREHQMAMNHVIERALKA